MLLLKGEIISLWLWSTGTHTARALQQHTEQKSNWQGLTLHSNKMQKSLKSDKCPKHATKQTQRAEKKKILQLDNKL